MAKPSTVINFEPMEDRVVLSGNVSGVDVSSLTSVDQDSLPQYAEPAFVQEIQQPQAASVHHGHESWVQVQALSWPSSQSAPVQTSGVNSYFDNSSEPVHPATSELNNNQAIAKGGTFDETSSCWIRTSQIAIGGSKNQSMPPFGLPGSATVSGLKSNSSPGGGGNNENTSDAVDDNQTIRLHAQYDMSSTVTHDDTQTVGALRTVTVGAVQSVTV